MEYVLDANVFIQAHRVYYAFDLVPAYWCFLVDAGEDSVQSIDHIYNEIVRLDDKKLPVDDLADWAMNEAPGIFKSSGQTEIIEAYRDIMKWAVNCQQFSDAAKAAFADGADAWIVAYASAKGLTVVTQESFEPNIRRKIKIPNVCEAFGVSWVDTFTMLRNLRFFVDKYTIRE